jgi:hypothetical protein
MTSLCVSGRMTWLMSGQVLERFNRVRDCLIRTAARVQAGRYAPRRRAGRPRPPDIRKPWQPGPLPREFGWLAARMPATARSHRADLDALIRHPEMVALIAAAPSTVIPPLRSLCWALQLAPPPVLARPSRATPIPAEPATPAQAMTPEAAAPEAPTSQPSPAPPAPESPPARPPHPSPRFASPPPNPA